MPKYKAKANKELNRKPINIETLNIRVDTARDLVLKLYNTTLEMVKMARLAETSIIYGNRFRSSYQNIDISLTEAKKMFYKGNYKKSLDISLKTISTIDKGLYQKMISNYQ